MTTMNTRSVNPIAREWADMGPSEARAMLVTAHPAYTEANAEREFALLMCGQTGVPAREIGHLIGRDGSTAWERIKTLRKKWREDRLEWPEHIRARLDAYPTPQPDEPHEN